MAGLRWSLQGCAQGVSGIAPALGTVLIANSMLGTDYQALDPGGISTGGVN
jgi:hypothetical protein